MTDLTATVLTYNEEQNIRACLESLTWVKEIIVVDSGSSDCTIEICRDYTDKIFLHPWAGFIEQKNYAVSLAGYDWILNVDADEQVPEELRHAIERELAAPRHDGYWIARRNYFLGRWMRHGGWYPDRVLRLFNRRKGRFGGVDPHASFIVPEGSVGVISGDLIHRTYQDLSQYLRKQDWYSGISAEERIKVRQRSGSITRAELLLRAMLKFAQVYLLKRGFLDGIHGWIAATGASYFNFIKYAKVWECGLRAGSDRADDSQRERPVDAHDPFPSISEYLRRIDRDSTLRALELHREGKRAGPFDLLFRPPSTFLKIYLLQGSIREGLRGLVLAGLSASYTFAQYAKLWEYHRMNRHV